VTAGARFSRESIAAPQVDVWSVGTQLGVGADWFPVDEISIGGSVGVGAEYLSAEREGFESSSRWSLNTFTSALTLHIYF
jgi:hypothetical protein